MLPWGPDGIPDTAGGNNVMIKDSNTGKMRFMGKNRVLNGAPSGYIVSVHAHKRTKLAKKFDKSTGFDNICNDKTNHG